MKHVIFTLLFFSACIFAALSSFAQTPIKQSAIPAQAAPASTDNLVGWRPQTGVNPPYNFTLGVLNTYFSANVTGLTNAQITGLAWSKLTGVPGTFAPAAHAHAISDTTGLQTAIDGKQAALVSGVTLRTVNGVSLLGSGDIPVSGGGGGDMFKATYDANGDNVVDSSASAPWSGVSGKPAFATVATSGSYLDLSNRPTIPASPVNADWGAVTGLAQILNKPSIPAAQVAADLAASGATGTTGVLPVAKGGTGTATPGLVAGANVTVTGSWPNQTIAAASGTGSGDMLRSTYDVGLDGVIDVAALPTSYPALTVTDLTITNPIPDAAIPAGVARDSEVTSALLSKQDALVSGTSIRTVNGTSLLGSGNIAIAGGGGTASPGQISLWATADLAGRPVDTLPCDGTNGTLNITGPSGASYIVQGNATGSAPTFSPVAGTYASGQSVSISGTSGYTIRYTTDGGTPTRSVGTVYSAPISVAATATLRAVEYKDPSLLSSVGLATYVITAGNNITANLWQTFEIAGTVDAAALAANDNHASASWTVAGTPTTAANAHNTSLSTINTVADTGTLGIVLNHNNNGRISVDLNSYPATQSFGFWFNVTALDDGGYSNLYSLGANGFGADSIAAVVASRTGSAYSVNLRGVANSAGVTISAGTWYYITGQMIVNGACAVRLYSAAGTAVGAEQSVTGRNNQPYYHAIGSSNSASGETRVSNFVINSATATYPLGP